MLIFHDAKDTPSSASVLCMFIFSGCSPWDLVSICVYVCACVPCSPQGELGIVVCVHQQLPDLLRWVEPVELSPLPSLEPADTWGRTNGLGMGTFTLVIVAVYR